MLPSDDGGKAAGTAAGRDQAEGRLPGQNPAFEGTGSHDADRQGLRDEHSPVQSSPGGSGDPVYQKYDLVIATDYGLPIGEAAIRKRFKKLIKDHDLPDVVFHSLRHTSVTYKLKLNGGDIKAVQGDSGHAQVNMVTDVYSHILDEDRKRNAELFEEAFYGKKNLNPQMIDAGAEKMITVPDGVDAETLMKVLGNPEMVALLSSLAKTIQK